MLRIQRLLCSYYSTVRVSTKYNNIMMKLLVVLALQISGVVVHGFSAEPQAAISRSRVPLKGIEASKFRHPLDRDLTSFIQKAPFSSIVEGGIRRSLSLVEQGTRIDLLGSSVKVSEQQLPTLHKAMEDASRLLDIDVTPELYVQSSSQANAYTLALSQKETKPIVVVTSALLDRCSDEEVEAIIGHELGHLKCSHSLYLTLGGLASASLRGLPVLGSQTEKLLQQWRLAAEYSCDRAALLVAQDVNVVAGAMLKLFAGTSRATNTQAFIDQSREYEQLLKDANPLVRNSIKMQLRTHPLPVKRVAELEKWFKSDEYKNLVSREE